MRNVQVPFDEHTNNPCDPEPARNLRVNPLRAFFKLPHTILKLLTKGKATDETIRCQFIVHKISYCVYLSIANGH